MTCPMKQSLWRWSTGRRFCYVFVQPLCKPVVLEAEKLKIAQNWITHVKKPQKWTRHEEKHEKLDGFERLSQKQTKESADINRGNQSLEFSYGKTDPEFGICIIQQPVLPNKQVFFSFCEGSGTLAMERQVRSLDCSIHCTIEKFELNAWKHASLDTVYLPKPETVDESQITLELPLQERLPFCQIQHKGIKILFPSVLLKKREAEISHSKIF